MLLQHDLNSGPNYNYLYNLIPIPNLDLHLPWNLGISPLTCTNCSLWLLNCLWFSKKTKRYLSLPPSRKTWVATLLKRPHCPLNVSNFDLYLHVQDFVASDPILSEFKAEILKYQGIEQEIENIETTFRVGYGAIEMYSGKRSSLNNWTSFIVEKTSLL